MLVKCQNCGVSFDHKMGRCAVCKTVVAASGEERVAMLTEEATNWRRNGYGVAFVRDRLAREHNLTNLDLDDVMRRSNAVLRNQSRAHGRHIVVSGMVLLLIAGATYVFTRGFIVASGCLTLGLAMIVLGEIKIITGWNITGRDDG